MASKETDSTLIRGHEYDGIQEFDNPTPTWWHLIWLSTMVLSVFYFAMSLWSPMFTHQTDRLVAAQEAEIQRLFADIGELENTEETILSLMDDEKWMTFGASVFRGNCVSCHDSDGGGNVGPNLKDDAWKNVTRITDIHDVIANGAAAGAMPPWANRMHPNEMVLLSAYVATLRGQSGGKAAEGEIIPPWPTRSSEAQTDAE
ncbi:MAG: c-type cytochrome [Planctomycetota bacterium]